MVESMNKIVMLSYEGEYAHNILKFLALDGIFIDSVVLCKPPINKKVKIIKKISSLIRQKGLYETLKIIFYKTIKFEKKHSNTMIFYSNNIIEGGHLNDESLKNVIQSLKPDYILFGTLGIVDDEIIKIPKKGCINVHPGLLPLFRNVGVVGCALKQNYPVGVTAHFVDAGVDTGDIISIKLVPISLNETLQSIENKANFVSCQLMADIVRRIVKSETLSRKPQQHTDRSKCTWLSKKERRELDYKISNGLALILYNDWKTKNLEPEIDKHV